MREEGGGEGSVRGEVSEGSGGDQRVRNFTEKVPLGKEH